jgi:dihydroorotate dehydrogenase
LVFRGLGLLAEIKAEMLRALEGSRSESLADLIGVDAAALTGEPWPK